MIRSYQGHMPKFPASCYIDISAQVLGDVEIGEHSSVWMNAVIRGDVNSIRIGANSNVQDCAVLHGQRHLYSVTVGDWVTIGHNATVHGCVVEDAVLIGMGVTILNDCRIGEDPLLPQEQCCPSTPWCRPGPFGLEYQGSFAVNSAMMIGPSSCNMPRITSTTPRSIWQRWTNDRR